MKTVINRIFYVDVSGMDPTRASEHIKQFKAEFSVDNPNLNTLKKAGFWEDLFIPVQSRSNVELLSVNYDEDGK